MIGRNLMGFSYSVPCYTYIPGTFVHVLCYMGFFAFIGNHLFEKRAFVTDLSMKLSTRVNRQFSSVSMHSSSIDVEYLEF